MSDLDELAAAASSPPRPRRPQKTGVLLPAAVLTAPLAVLLLLVGIKSATESPPSPPRRPASLEAPAPVERGSDYTHTESNGKDVYVRGYRRRDGTYVHPYWRRD